MHKEWFSIVIKLFLTKACAKQENKLTIQVLLELPEAAPAVLGLLPDFLVVEPLVGATTDN